MKKMLMILMLYVATATSVNAQRNGDLYVINGTNCDISVNAVARCADDCSTEYSGNVGTFIAPNGHPGFLLYNANSPVTPNPYFVTDPQTVCPGQWKWAYADVTILCNGTAYTVRVGDSNDPCNSGYQETAGFLLPQECIDECYDGQNIHVRWDRLQAVPNSTAVTIGQ